MTELLPLIPKSMHARAERYQSQLSSYNYVVGRILLRQGLEALGRIDALNSLEFQENGKPMISGVNFNISHSGFKVICAFANEAELGIDIEKIEPKDFDNFNSMFSTKEWNSIRSAENPLQRFFWFWTRKESIIKALGWNLNYLHQIELDVTLDHFIVAGQKWYLKDLDFGKEYVGAICSKVEIDEIKMIKVEI